MLHGLTLRLVVGLLADFAGAFLGWQTAASWAPESCADRWVIVPLGHCTFAAFPAAGALENGLAEIPILGLLGVTSWIQGFFLLKDHRPSRLQEAWASPAFSLHDCEKFFGQFLLMERNHWSERAVTLLLFFLIFLTLKNWKKIHFNFLQIVAALLATQILSLSRVGWFADPFLAAGRNFSLPYILLALLLLKTQPLVQKFSRILVYEPFFIGIFHALPDYSRHQVAANWKTEIAPCFQAHPPEQVKVTYFTDGTPASMKRIPNSSFCGQQTAKN